MKPLGIALILLLMVAAAVSVIEIVLDWWSAWRIRRSENRRWDDGEHLMLVLGESIRREK